MYVFFLYIFSERSHVKVVFAIISLYLLTVFPFSVQSQQSKGVSTDKIIEIVNDDLKDQGINRIKEIQKTIKSKNSKNIAKHFSKYTLEQTEIATRDTIFYAVESDSLDFEFEEVKAFFATISKNIPKKHIIVSERSKAHEPIGMEFSLRFPSKRQPFDQSCSHHTITFRRNAKGKLLIREWYSMPGYMDCL